MSARCWSFPSFPKVPLGAIGLLFLADLSTAAERTALTGNGAYLDVFVICPGLHRQQSAPELSSGEYPACGALRSGYVFRVENSATVAFLQKVGRSGQLTTLKVSQWEQNPARWQQALSVAFVYQNASPMSIIAYLAATCLTTLSFLLLILTQDYWGLGVLSILVLARLLNTYVIQKRCTLGWHGEKEPGVDGDLLILLSQDRWVRMKGPVDDLKAVTSGAWLREQSFVESSISAAATVLVYLDAALASNVNDAGKMILLILLIVSPGLLAIANECTKALFMHGCKVEVVGKRKSYKRRLELVEDLLQEKGRNDDAMRYTFSQMGMTVPAKSAVAAQSANHGQVIM